jgi:hypothetical protein
VVAALDVLSVLGIGLAFRVEAASEQRLLGRANKVRVFHRGWAIHFDSAVLAHASEQMCSKSARVAFLSFHLSKIKFIVARRLLISVCWNLSHQWFDSPLSFPQ